MAASQIPFERRKGSEPDLFTGGKRVHDASTGMDIVKIFSGDWYVTDKANEMVATILGSCVSACIRDPVLGIGGMNHFLLPGDTTNVPENEAARYGVFAMESLINGILKMGGQKSRLEVKVFGGGNVIKNSAAIGSKNAAFVRSFLKDEGLRILSEDLEGDYPRRVHYYPVTGKVMMRKLQRKDDMRIIEQEKAYQQKIAAKPVEGDIDLF